MRDLGLRQQFAEYGVHFSDLAVTAEPAVMQTWRRNMAVAADANPFLGLAANDAQPALGGVPNAAIPAFLTNIVDPELIRYVFTPMRAAQIIGETKKGDWTILSAQFPTIEPVGQVASYGDFNNNGSSDFNADWTPRQSYHYQTISQWGEREIAIWGAASINGAAEKRMAAAFTMMKFQNRSYFYGISGLTNYGLLNDPSIPTPGTPATKAGGGTTWVTATAAEIYNDFLALFARLNTQMGGNIQMDDPMKLVLSTTRMPLLETISTLTLQPVSAAIKKAFPNMTIEFAPEYTTAGGELIQLILPSYEGTNSAYAAFTEKMRAHPLIAAMSAWKQKFSGGTWGTIIRRPLAIASLLGI